MDCLFCKIAAGEIPSTKVYEDETVLETDRQMAYGSTPVYNGPEPAKEETEKAAEILPGSAAAEDGGAGLPGLIQRRESVRDQLSRKPFALQTGVVMALFLVTLIFGAYGMGYDASQFIYNRF